VVPLIGGETPRFHTLPVSMPSPAKQADASPSQPSFGEENWLPSKSSSQRAHAPNVSLA